MDNTAESYRPEMFPYMRCDQCGMLLSQKRIQRDHQCPCGSWAFRTCGTTRLQRLVCRLLGR